MEIVHTYNSLNDELLGSKLHDDYLGNGEIVRVKFWLTGGFSLLRLKYTSKIESTLNDRTSDLVYDFLEHDSSANHPEIFILMSLGSSNFVVAFRNYHGIGRDWKLYINSKADVVVQHVLFPETDITVRFRNFPMDDQFYIHLSCLIYTLTNYELQDSSSMQSIFQNVLKIVVKQ